MLSNQHQFEVFYSTNKDFLSQIKTNIKKYYESDELNSH